MRHYLPWYLTSFYFFIFGRGIFLESLAYRAYVCLLMVSEIFHIIWHCFCTNFLVINTSEFGTKMLKDKSPE